MDTFTASSPLNFANQTVYRFKRWLPPTLMGDTAGWAGIELLLWHLLCKGNGTVQQKGRTRSGQPGPPSKLESQTVGPGGVEKSRTWELLLPLSTSRWGQTGEDSADSHPGAPLGRHVRPHTATDFLRCVLVV